MKGEYTGTGKTVTQGAAPAAPGDVNATTVLGQNETTVLNGELTTVLNAGATTVLNQGMIGKLNNNRKFEIVKRDVHIHTEEVI